MADITIDDLAAALQEEELRGRLENPWYRAGVNTNQNRLAVGEGDKWYDILGASLIQGLAGGAMQGYGQKSALEDYNEIKRGVTSALSSEDPSLSFEEAEDPALRRIGLAYGQERRKQDLLQEQIEQKQQEEVQKFKRNLLFHQQKKEIDTAYDLEKAEKMLPLAIERAKAGRAITNITNKTPTGITKDIYDTRNEMVKSAKQAKSVLDALDEVDPNENLFGAAGRKLIAKFLPGSDSADLERQMKQGIFSGLKGLFPGALSDEERRAMMQVMGADGVVPVGMLKRIWERKIDQSVDVYNTALESAQDGGFAVDFKPLTAEQFLGPRKASSSLEANRARQAEIKRKLGIE